MRQSQDHPNHEDQVLEGTGGPDQLFGGWGNDTLTGGAGNDRLWGLHGDDLFVFEPGSGRDTIYGFRAGEGSDDVILLRDSGIEDFETLMTTAVWSRGATTFTLPDGSEIVIRGRKPDDFHADDFRFEVSTPPLFTEDHNVVDFNLLQSGEYIDGTQYHGLGGDDVVTLATDTVAALATGFVAGTVFDAGDGNDTVFGGAMDDIIEGGAGNDTIYAGTGFDTLSGGAGNDRILIDELSPEDVIDGGGGIDTLVWVGDENLRNYFQFQDSTYTGPRILLDTAQGGQIIGYPYTTVIVSGLENFDLTGGQYNDSFYTLGGDDILRGLAGNDYLSAGTGQDVVEAGEGRDYVLLRDLGGDIADGGAGTDYLTLGGSNIAHGVLDFNMTTGAATIDGAATSTLTNFEHLTVYAGFQGGTITGTDDSNNINVYGTGFTINAGLGHIDRITIHEGGNDVHGGGGALDSLTIATTNDVIIDLAAGTYDVSGVTAAATGFTYVSTSTGNDHITGTDSNDVINVSSGTDHVDAGGGSDFITVYAGGGDTINGGTGQDTLSMGYTAAQAGSGVTIDMVNGTISDASGVLTYFTSIEHISGSAGNDLILGSDVAERLNGGNGNDIIHTGGSVVPGYASYDMVYAGSGDDTIYLEAATAYVDGGTGTDTFIFVDDGSGNARDIVIYDASRAEGDVIDLTAMGITEADILAGYSEVNGRYSVIDIGDIQITLYGIDASEFGTDLFLL